MNRKDFYKAMLLIIFTPIVSYADSDGPIVEKWPGICETKSTAFILPCQNKTPPNDTPRSTVYSISVDDSSWPRATDVNGNIGDTSLGAHDQGIALGSFAYALLASTAVGGGSVSYGKYGVVIGGNSQIDIGAANSVAVGYNSYVAATAKSSVALGYNSAINESNVVSIGSSGDNFDGDIKILRKLVNLDDGDISADSKEAINGSQLQSVKDSIETNKDRLDTTNIMAEENARSIIDLITRVGVLEKKCNP